MITSLLRSARLACLTSKTSKMSESYSAWSARLAGTGTLGIITYTSPIVFCAQLPRVEACTELLIFNTLKLCCSSRHCTWLQAQHTNRSLPLDGTGGEPDWMKA